MRLRLVLAAGVIAAAVSGCGGVFGRQYEYEEQYYLETSGAATVVLDASIPALVALRGMPFSASTVTGLVPAQVRAMFETAGCQVVHVSEPWRRSGRRFIQVTMKADDVRQFSKCAPLVWSSYTGMQPEADGTRLRYRQDVGAAAGVDPGAVNWTGGEIVAFKLHLPSHVLEHNARRLDNGNVASIERGNILTWEQRLDDRRAGKPVAIDVAMEPQSILYRTLWLFAGAFVSAVALMMLIIAMVVRQGRKRHRPA